MCKFESMRMLQKGVLLLFLGIIILGCKKKVEEDPIPEVTPKVQIEVFPVYGGNDLFLDSTYVTPEGYDVKFSELRFYLENIRNGANLLIDAALFDYRVRGNLLCLANGSFANFSNLQGNVGVDSALNHDDPSAFPNSSWLNIANANDMHWGWNPGYIFIKVEAKVDTIADAIPLFDHNVVFHIGLDANLNTLSLTNCQWNDAGNDLHKLGLRLDMQQFLTGISNPIDLKTEYSSHSAAGQEAITAKVALNFKNALSLF